MALALSVNIQNNNNPWSILTKLHSPLTSRPSQIAGKREELWIQKNQTLTTKGLARIHSFMINL